LIPAWEARPLSEAASTSMEPTRNLRTFRAGDWDPQLRIRLPRQGVGGSGSRRIFPAALLNKAVVTSPRTTVWPELYIRRTTEMRAHTRPMAASWPAPAAQPSPWRAVGRPRTLPRYLPLPVIGLSTLRKCASRLRVVRINGVRNNDRIAKYQTLPGAADGA